MTTLHRYGWIVAYAALILAGLYIVLWLASYSGGEGVREQVVDDDCLRRPRKVSVDCGEMP